MITLKQKRLEALSERSGSGGFFRGCLGKQEAPSSIKTRGLFRFHFQRASGQEQPPDYSCPILYRQPLKALIAVFTLRWSVRGKQNQRSNSKRDKIGRKKVPNFSVVVIGYIQNETMKSSPPRRQLSSNELNPPRYDMSSGDDGTVVGG
jgi:hypothetical protein